MFHKTFVFRQQPNRQQGSALVVAVFVIVVMSALAAGINQSISSSVSQSSAEIMGTRALFAAETGNEIALAKVFPIDGSPASCIASEYHRFTAEGLNQCIVEVNCNTQIEAAVSYYQIQSKAVCKATLSGVNITDINCTAGEFCVSRGLEVEAKVL